MEYLLKQKRVRFSGPEQTGSISAQKRESFRRDNKGHNWFQKQSFRQMSWDYEFKDTDFSAAVAATAFAVYSLDEAEENRRKMREEYEKSKTETRTRTRKDDASTGSVRVTRQSSAKEVSNTGKTSIRKPAEQDQRVQDTAMPSRKPSRSASMRPMVSTDQRQKGSSSRMEVESKVDSWEKAQLRKINKRYEKMKSEIIAWENAKKMEAKLHMERKKNELELRKSRNLQHYQIKVERIDAVAGGARGKLEEKRRNEELEVKKKAKHMRSKGKNPVKCFCC